MAYKQIKSFSTSKGGTAKGMCLANVRSGFAIAAILPTAWVAWQKTQQHTGAMPEGVDVPVFFSYWATIDGEYKNWGHIGVRLANGKFWSDGATYDSIEAYTKSHKPKYVGWGESVNGIRVIEKVPEPAAPAFNLPPVNSQIRLKHPDTRTTFRAGTADAIGKIRVTDNTFVYTVRGHDPQYPNRIIINSASGGGNSVSLALYYLNGNIIPGWVRV